MYGRHHRQLEAWGPDLYLRTRYFFEVSAPLCDGVHRKDQHPGHLSGQQPDSDRYLSKA